MRNLLALIAALLLLFPACKGSGKTEKAEADTLSAEKQTPIRICDTAYTLIDTLPVAVMANADTKMTLPDSLVMDLRYPSYKGTLRIAVSDTAANAVRRYTDAMTQRLGDNEAEQLRITSAGGYRTIILVSLAPTGVPMQFLTIGPSKILTGTFTFDTAPAPTDERLMPVIEALRRDAIRAAENFR